ncbi:MAG: putative membrane channel-forming protein YqfA (hemolysin III family) [Acidimicrobiales bacterium]|jgi:predicted membrane channel-forming protein YqfA (hemolysin III family)
MIDVDLIKPFLLIIFFVMTLVFMVFSLSIVYHWFAYGTNKAKSMLMLVTYLGISAILFIIMSLALNSL